MPTFFQIRAFINYWLEAVDKHSLHSPFFYDLYTNVIRQKPANDDMTKRIENLRKQLLKNNQTLLIEDLGSGSKHGSEKTRLISHVAKTSLTPPKFNALYNRIIKHYRAKRVIELGTSFGINTLYLSTNRQTQVTTFEGSQTIADVARLSFTLAEANNITLIEGDITHTLPSFLQKSEKLDVVFMDANHQYSATKTYFELIITKIHNASVVILDDIHNSGEMEKAWNEIRTHRLVYATADLYRCGLVFFDPSLNKQHVVLQF